MQISLRKEFFTEKEKVFVEYSNLKASLFVYESGVCAVRLSNALGEIVVLPFKGQQIWDAVFEGRRLTMESMFPEPKNVDYFVNTYGCFVMHCGALRVGAPGPKDKYHPNHGELPYADYDKAWITAGEDENGKFIGLNGLYEYGEAWVNRYDARPIVRLYENLSLMDISMTIQNRSNSSMEFMYLCHPNFMLADGGRIVQKLENNENNSKLLYGLPDQIDIDPEFLEKLQDRIDLNATVGVEDDFNSQIALVLSMGKPKTDNDGWAHFMQVHPDGISDYVAYDTNELDHCIRWMAKSKNEKVNAFALPATCETEGYTEEKKKGKIKTLLANEKITFNIIAGCLNKQQTEQMENKIQSL